VQTNPISRHEPVAGMALGDVHTRLTTYASDQLQPQLPAGLRARVEEYVVVEGDEDEEALRTAFRRMFQILNGRRAVPRRRRHAGCRRRRAA